MKHSLFKPNNGFTLIEIVVSILLLGIIAIGFLPLFTNSYSRIRQSGQRTEALYNIQSSIETSIVSAPTSQIITFTFDGYDLDINVSIFTVETSYGTDSKASITFFEADLDGF